MLSIANCLSYINHGIKYSKTFTWYNYIPKVVILGIDWALERASSQKRVKERLDKVKLWTDWFREDNQISINLPTGFLLQVYTCLAWWWLPDNLIHTICDRHICSDTIICLNVWHSNFSDGGHLVSGLILFQWHVKTDSFVNTPFPAGVMGYPGLNEYSSSWQTRVMGY